MSAYECKKCSKRFRTHWELQRHMHRKLTRDYQCDICGIRDCSASERQSIVYLLKGHVELTWQCRDCYTRFIEGFKLLMLAMNRRGCLLDRGMRRELAMWLL